MEWRRSAPSNIALIKYMGKEQKRLNQPVNDSLSYTLTKYQTMVQLNLKSKKQVEDSWEPLIDQSYTYKPYLNSQAQEKFLDHLKRIKVYYGLNNQAFYIRSASNFPDSCGIASSASSFAALTLCAAHAFTEITHIPLPSLQELSALSHLGSGSSCRSFFEPWALWQTQQNNVQAMNLPYENLLHNVFLVSEKKKIISSSQAHQLVSTSLLFESRPKRAQQRLVLLMKAFEDQNWPKIFSLVWQEWWDMHSLFETCEQPFGYLEPLSLYIVNFFRNMWDKKNDGPLVTLDAGPNVHVLFRQDQHDLREECCAFLATKEIKIL